jgi:hypothetical protein
MPGGRIIARRYRAFLEELPLLCRNLGLPPGDLLFTEYVNFIAEWLEQKPPNA